MKKKVSRGVKLQICNSAHTKPKPSAVSSSNLKGLMHRKLELFKVTPSRIILMSNVYKQLRLSCP